MPRSPFRSEVLATPTPALYAAAKHYKVGKSSKTGTGKDSGEAWQSSCWDYYDMVGEYRYAVNWVGNLLSRARLTILHNGKAVADDENANAALQSLFGGPSGQSEMFRQLGIHFTVAGEAFIVGVDGASEEDWYVVAATEVHRGNGQTSIWGERIDGDHLLLRLWRPHPRKFKKSDAPSRSVIPILSEINQLTKHVAAQIDSRLAGAGLLLLPSEISFPTRTKTEGTGADEVTSEVDGAQGFIDELIEVMSTAIANREDASALVPIVLQVAGEYLDKVQHLTFWSDLDEHAIELRTEAIRRLSLGMDMPPEVLTGTGDMNHWGAWQVDESAIKSHSEPLLAVITSSLTTGYLRPYLEAAGMDAETADEYEFGVDTAALRMRPNRSKEAVELYDRGELSGEAMRRENGFNEDDDMRKSELKEWFVRKVAGGSTTPELVAAALTELGIQLEITAAPEVVPTEERPARSLDEHPVRELPDETPLLAAAEQMVFRALERAGNRLKTKVGTKFSGTPAADLYLRMPKLSHGEIEGLLTDAWTSVGRFDYGVSADRLTESLEQYAKTLISMRKEYDRDDLRAHLETLSR